jgi:hypothetical protein
MQLYVGLTGAEQVEAMALKVIAWSAREIDLQDIILDRDVILVIKYVREKSALIGSVDQTEQII